MEDFRTALFSRAFMDIPAGDYNRVSWNLREERAKGGPVLYEVVLDESLLWQDLRDRVYPALARYVKAKGMNPESAEGVVVSLFYENRCHLIEGPGFYSTFREIEAIDQGAFRLRVRRWLSEGDPKKAQPLLPAGPGAGAGHREAS